MLIWNKIGINSEQFENFNFPAASGFTADAVSAFDSSNNCVGIGPKFLGNLSLAGFSGLDSLCIEAAKGDAFSTVTAAQIAMLTPDGASGTISKFEIIFWRKKWRLILFWGFHLFY